MENDYQQKVAARRLFWIQYSKDLTECAKALLRTATIASAESLDTSGRGLSFRSGIQYTLQEAMYDLEILDTKLSHLEPIHPPKKKEEDE